MPQRFVGSRWRGLKSRLVFFADTNPNFQARNMYVQTSLNPKRRSKIRRNLAIRELATYVSLKGLWSDSIQIQERPSRKWRKPPSQVAGAKSEKFDARLNDLNCRPDPAGSQTLQARKQLRLSGTSPMCRRRPAITAKIHTLAS